MKSTQTQGKRQCYLPASPCWSWLFSLSAKTSKKINHGGLERALCAFEISSYRMEAAVLHFNKLRYSLGICSCLVQNVSET